MHISGRLGVAVLAASLLATSSSLGAEKVVPPQGYIGLVHTFSVPPPTSALQSGFHNFDYDFVLGEASASLAGTFWAFDFSFGNSTGQLPNNHVNKNPPVDQGGYVGVQILSATESIAIFSIWWALNAEAGEGATCLHGDERWRTDDNKVAGGPYYSCRLPIKLNKGVRYRLRLAEISDARKPGQPEWWGVWLINVRTGAETHVGRIQTRGPWRWLNAGTGGFIEHFGPMPLGCRSIPKSQATFFSARADYQSYKASIGAYVYGTCERPMKARTIIDCKPALSCSIRVN